MAEGGELERTAMEQDKGAGVAIDEADNNSGDKGALIESDFEEFYHEQQLVLVGSVTGWE